MVGWTLEKPFKDKVMEWSMTSSTLLYLLSSLITQACCTALFFLGVRYM